MTTYWDPALGFRNGLADLVDIWAPPIYGYSKSFSEKIRREKGMEVLWYLYVKPWRPFPNFFIEYHALDPRILSWMGFDNGVDGILHYKLNRWADPKLPKKPIPIPIGNKLSGKYFPANTFGPYNGDGSLFYPGVKRPFSSIRLENFRDGLEEWELLKIAKARGINLKKLGLETVLTSVRDYRPDSARFQKMREKLLNSF